MLAQLDDALLRPWNDLAMREQAFVAGYMCHLAVDEVWKAFCQRLLDKLGLARWSDLPVPVGVLMTAYHVLGTALFAGSASIAPVLAGTEIPDVMRHIPHHVLSRLWIIAGPYALNGRTPESYCGVLERMGKSETEIQAVRKNHKRYWEEAVTFVKEQEDIESIVASVVERSLEVIPRLWERCKAYK